MKRKFGLWPLAWALFGLLVLSGALFLLGARESRTNPSAISFGPSGTRGFADLLRKFGHDVQVTSASNPSLEADDLVLGFVLGSSFGEREGPDAPNVLGKSLRKHVERGGRAFVLKVAADFPTASRMASGSPQRVAFERSVLPAGTPSEATVSIGQSLDPYFDEGLVRPEDPFVRTVRTTSGQPVMDVHRTGRGMVAVLHDGIGATNRFLDKEQNAEFLLWSAAWLKPSNGRIVILEAMHGAAIDPGLLGILGGWVAAGWWQLVLALVVIGFTLGRRFGLPETDRTHQRSTRELVDAYADTMNRSRKPQVAMKRIVSELDRLVRRRFNLPAELSSQRRNEALPPKLANALVQAELAAESKVDERTATMLLFRLEDEIAAIDGRTLPTRRKRRRS
jgi:hypothetical protein